MHKVLCGNTIAKTLTSHCFALCQLRDDDGEIINLSTLLMLNEYANVNMLNIWNMLTLLAVY